MELEGWQGGGYNRGGRGHGEGWGYTEGGSSAAYGAGGCNSIISLYKIEGNGCINYLSILKHQFLSPRGSSIAVIIY